MNEAEPIGHRLSKWGEGPLWYNDQLIYVDIESHVIVFFSIKKSRETTIKLDQRVGFVVPMNKKDKWIWGGDNGLYELDVDSKKSVLIGNPESLLLDNRFNDGKVSPDGRLFAGTISLIKRPQAALYRLDGEKFSKICENVTNSNGLAWSPKGDLFYYIDTPTKKVKVFEYNPKTGDLQNPEVAIDTSFISASPDGMCIDNKGMLWVAFCHGGCVINFNPQSGKKLRRITIPVLETTSCCFGGDKGNNLYITSGVHKTKKEKWAGSIFVVKNLDVSAPPATAVKI